MIYLSIWTKNNFLERILHHNVWEYNKNSILIEFFENNKKNVGLLLKNMISFSISRKLKIEIIIMTLDIN